jgi:AcrR family transcriptional regulator
MSGFSESMEDSPVELLTVRQLSELTGMPRSTIQFYIREEILPPPQRLPNGRPIYGRIHARLLGQIKSLKAEGQSLEEIRQQIGDSDESASFYQVDAAGAIQTATRERIVEAAARQFARNGYNRARLSDIIKQAGVTPQVFASHFSSKKELFAETFGVVSKRVSEMAIPAMDSQLDLGGKLLARFENLLHSRMPDSGLWALARSEALYEGGEPAATAQQAYRKMSSLHVGELARLRQESGTVNPQVSDELMAYCFLGAEEFLIMRLGWDAQFSVDDAVEAYRLLIRSVHAEYGGKCEHDDE